MPNILKNIRWKDIILLNVIILTIYFLVLSSLKIGISEKILFSTPDSRDYLNAGKEIFQNSIGTDASTRRPFLYPLLIIIASKTGDPFCLWLVQFLFWTASINFTYLSLLKMTANKYLSFFASLAVALNFTLLVLTLHALTEVITVFLLSLLIFFVSHVASSRKELGFPHVILLILCLLTVVKPMFLVPMVLFLLVMPVFYLKKYLQRPIFLVVLLLVLSPLIFQTAFMKSRHGTFSISNIGPKTFKAYLLKQGMNKIEDARNNNHNDKEIAQKADNLTVAETFDLLFDNKLLYLNLYFKNINENTDAAPVFLSYPKGFEHKMLAKFMRKTNKVYTILHFVFFIPVIFMIYIFFKKRDMDNLLLMLIMSGLSWYIFLSSGISFWQGDRLVIIALPVWISLYGFTGVQMLNYLRTDHKTGKLKPSLISCLSF